MPVLRSRHGDGTGRKSSTSIGSLCLWKSKKRIKGQMTDDAYFERLFIIFSCVAAFFIVGAIVVTG